MVTELVGIVFFYDCQHIYVLNYIISISIIINTLNLCVNRKITAPNILLNIY